MEEVRWKRMTRTPTPTSPMRYFFTPVSRDTGLRKTRHCLEVYQWCTDQFGPANGDGRWSMTGHHVYFQGDLEATAFYIRWG